MNSKTKKKAKTKANAKTATIKVSAKQIRLASFIILCCSIILWVIIKAQNPTTFPVKVVAVEGQYHYTKPEQVQRLLTPYVSKGFFNVNVRAIKQRLLTLPWVDKVAVKQVWPHKIVVRYTEQQPLVLWNDRSVINTRGELFTPNPANLPRGLPRLQGSLAQEPLILHSYRRMRHKLKPLGLHISALAVSADHSYTVTLDNGMKVMLGQHHIWQRLHRFVRVYPRLFSGKRHHARIVDLRYNHGVAVKWS